MIKYQSSGNSEELQSGNFWLYNIPVKIGKKWPSYAHLKLGKKWGTGLFWAENWPFLPLFLRYGRQICIAHYFHCTKGQTKIEVNWTQIDRFSLKKSIKMAISHNPILPNWKSPKSLGTPGLNFSMNFSETFTINVKMDFANNNHGGFLKSISQKMWPKWPIFGPK